MSLYNMMNGVNLATFVILPMLGKHPDEYPRFRDCFIDDDKIQILTRTGGGNREGYIEEIQMMRNMDEYIDDYDEENDNTYAYWNFSVPTKWKNDFNKIIDGKIKNISEEYITEMKRVFPKLSKEIDKIKENND